MGIALSRHLIEQSLQALLGIQCDSMDDYCWTKGLYLYTPSEVQDFYTLGSLRQLNSCAPVSGRDDLKPRRKPLEKQTRVPVRTLMRNEYA